MTDTKKEAVINYRPSTEVMMANRAGKPEKIKRKEGEIPCRPSTEVVKKSVLMKR